MLTKIGCGEKHRRYIGFRYIIRVFLVVFFSLLTYLSRYVRVFFMVCRPYKIPYVDLITYLIRIRVRVRYVMGITYLITYLKDKIRYKVRVRLGSFSWL